MRVFLAGVGIVAILITGYFGYMWITYIDDIVSAGSGYGFEIGNSKDEVVATVKKLYKYKKLSLGYNVYDKSDARNKILDLEKDSSLFYEEDSWRFYSGQNI